MYGVFHTEVGRLIWVATYDTLEDAKANHGPESVDNEECLIVIALAAFSQRRD